MKADGAVWFGHWGCKHTLGAAQLAKKKFEEAGIPMLLLDGDGCDRSHGGEGQTSIKTRSILEMLGAEEMEGGQDELRHITFVNIHQLNYCRHLAGNVRI